MVGHVESTCRFHALGTLVFKSNIEWHCLDHSDRFHILPSVLADAPVCGKWWRFRILRSYFHGE
jgi:hypothetical protein